ncbi:MAG: AraC family transcriptional regulator [bacterium]|nr:AraC family transcriptional regulator [bacterium]
MWSKAIVDLMGMEVSRALPGNEAVITRLIEVLVIGAVRDWMLNNRNETAGWISAVRDCTLGHAIAALHENPEKSWTVASLADKAAMSRTAFAEKFKELIGIPPMHYLNHLRMNLAADMLRTTDNSIAQIAREIAYSSEISFSRAFKRFWGKPPGSFRNAPEPPKQFGISLEFNTNNCIN